MTAVIEHKGLVLIDDATNKTYDSFKAYVNSLAITYPEIQAGQAKKSGVRYLCFNSGTAAAQKWTFLNQVKEYVPSLNKADASQEASPSKATNKSPSKAANKSPSKAAKPAQRGSPATTLVHNNDGDDDNGVKKYARVGFMDVEIAIVKERIASRVSNVSKELAQAIMHGGEITLSGIMPSCDSLITTRNMLEQLKDASQIVDRELQDAEADRIRNGLALYQSAINHACIGHDATTSGDAVAHEAQGSVKHGA